MMNRFRRLTCPCLFAVALGIALSMASAGPGDADPVWFRSDVKPAELQEALGDNVLSRWI